MTPPITYEVDGTQYIAFAGGLGRGANVFGPTDASVAAPPLLYVFTGEPSMMVPILVLLGLVLFDSRVGFRDRAQQQELAA